MFYGVDGCHGSIYVAKDERQAVGAFLLGGADNDATIANYDARVRVLEAENARITERANKAEQRVRAAQVAADHAIARANAAEEDADRLRDELTIARANTAKAEQQVRELEGSHGRQYATIERLQRERRERSNDLTPEHLDKLAEMCRDPLRGVEASKSHEHALARQKLQEAADWLRRAGA